MSTGRDAGGAGHRRRPINPHPDSPDVPMTQVHALPLAWRDRAELFERHGAAGSARLMQTLANELENAVTAADEQLLTLTEAAQRSGRSVETIRKVVSAGRLPNAGRTGRPRVRAADVDRMFPRKRVAAPERGAYDPIADAQSLLGGRGA